MSDLSPDFFNRPLAEVDPEVAEAGARFTRATDADGDRVGGAPSRGPARPSA